jgi:putative nucleotidyltransferase with HDIG domain
VRLFRELLALTLLAGALPVALLSVLTARQSAASLSSIAASAIAALALSLLVSALAARRVTKPLRDCVSGALAIARGRFGSQVDVRAHNEIADLAYTFNHMSRELAAYDAENRRLIAALERGYIDTLRSLASAVDAKDPYTHGHALRVAELSVAIGKELGLDAEQLRSLEYAGVLHDIGKLGVPEAILHKRAKLTQEELLVIRTHSAVGADIVRDVEFLRDALPAIRSHHERWDGLGYPDGLAGEAIPLIARIVNAADTWDACTSERTYQAAMPHDKALAILARLRGAQVDPRVHDALVVVIGRPGNEARQGAQLQVDGSPQAVEKDGQ